MPPATGQYVGSSIELEFVKPTVHAYIQRQKARRAVGVFARQYDIISVAAHNIGADLCAVVIEQNIKLAWRDFRADEAVHIRADALRKLIIAVQHAVRNAGTIEQLENADQNVARVAAAPLPRNWSSWRRWNYIRSIGHR
jgi:hypothetical protein